MKLTVEYNAAAVILLKGFTWRFRRDMEGDG